MKACFQIYIFLLFIAIGRSAHAQACAPVRTAIYFGNGVGHGAGTEDDAKDSLQTLQYLIKDASSQLEYESYEFKASYNHSAGRIKDISESAQQTFGNEWPSALVSLLLRNKIILPLPPPKTVQSFNDFLNSEAIRQMVVPNTW